MLGPLSGVFAFIALLIDDITQKRQAYRNALIQQKAKPSNPIKIRMTESF